MLNNFPRKVPKNSNLNWVHGFQRVLEEFSDFYHESVFFIFAGVRPRFLAIFSRSPRTSDLDFTGFGTFFSLNNMYVKGSFVLLLKHG